MISVNLVRTCCRSSTGAPMKQFELLPAAKRKPRRVLMHVTDAGGDGVKPACRFVCARCGHDSGRLICESIRAAKRGLPCPKCSEIRR